MAAATPARNVLNVPDVDEWVTGFAKRYKDAPHVQRWWTSTFRRWLLNEGPALPVMAEREIRSPWLAIIQKALTACHIDLDIGAVARNAVHSVNPAELPPWAASALADNTLMFVVVPGGDDEVDMYRHWADYLLTLPSRDIRMTVTHLRDAVALWDRQLAKAKLMSSLTEGVTVVETTAFDHVDPPVLLVKLDTRPAYEAESATMSHCVRSYFGRKDTVIYSIRGTAGERPLATIEVRTDHNAVVQVRGFANAKIDDALTTALQAWATEAGLRWYPRGLEDEDEGDEWDEGEEEEEVEDEEEDEDELPRRRVYRGRRVRRNDDEDEEEINAQDMAEQDPDEVVNRVAEQLVPRPEDVAPAVFVPAPAGAAAAFDRAVADATAIARDTTTLHVNFVHYRSGLGFDNVPMDQGMLAALTAVNVRTLGAFLALALVGHARGLRRLSIPRNRVFQNLCAIPGVTPLTAARTITLLQNGGILRP